MLRYRMCIRYTPGLYVCKHHPLLLLFVLSSQIELQSNPKRLLSFELRVM